MPEGRAASALRRTAWLALSVGALGVVAWVLPALRFERTVAIPAAGVVPERGLAFRYETVLDTTADKPHEVRSRVVLYEDGRALGPAHEEPDWIARRGRGAFVHQPHALVFSSSDGSDPRRNGRAYEARYPAPLPAWLVLPLAALVPFVLASAIPALLRTWLPHRDGLRRGLVVASQVVAAFAVIEFFGRALTFHLFARDGRTAESIYHQAFGTGPPDPEVPAPQYVARAYSMYSLNPERRLDGEPAVDEPFLVRRSEPLRPRDEVRLRILALGGSTTQDEKIRHEQLTWVYQLEARLRERLGPDVEVVNGGAGGFTIYENLVQYVTLLTYLEPDVVLFFEGINDVHPRIHRNTHLDYRDYNRAWWDGSRAQIEPSHSPLDFSWGYRFAVYELRYEPMRHVGIQALTRQPYPPPDTWRAALEATPPALFERIYGNFVTIVHAQGRRAVLLPQLWVPRNAEDEVFGVGVAQHNEVAASVARAHDADFLPVARLDAALGPDDVVDNCHFNPQGAGKMAALVADFLAEAGVLDAAPH